MKSVSVLLFGMSWSPALGIEVTSTVFQAKGKVTNAKVALIIDVNDGKRAGKQSLIIRIGILSVPGA